MASFTLKQESIGRFYIEMYQEKFSTAYTVTLSRDFNKNGLFSEIRKNVTANKKNALATFYRYRKEAKERSVNDG